MITSRQNPRVREVRDATRRRPTGEFVLEGPHLLEEALRADVPLILALISPSAPDALADVVRDRAARVLTVSEDVLAYASDSQHPQGIVALGRIPPLALDDSLARTGRLLLLDEVRDPGNLGTILRTAGAAGVAGVILAGHCVDPWNPKVVRASAGASFRVPVLSFPNRPQAGAWLAAHGQRAVRTTVDGRLSCFEADLSAPITIVLGNEAHGVHPDTAAFCSDSVHVPMRDACESLNLAATAAIVCYLALDRELALNRS